ncbi:hypothetical protein [Corynebacterium glyciniphilum]|uniref:hypothetical protein n=1 Tax=Corynebacterium glyciniphilum TaxID=1404244 RepID=UPI003FD2A61D
MLASSTGLLATVSAEPVTSSRAPEIMAVQPLSSECTVNDTFGKTVDYDDPSHRAESDAGAEAIATALHTPKTEEEQGHERVHLAVMDTIIANSTKDNPTGYRNDADPATSQRRGSEFP